MEYKLMIAPLFIVFLLLIVISIPYIIKQENSHYNYEDGFVDYEVVIWNEHDVILYNSNDLSDSIHMRLENAYTLVPEQMIQIHK